MGLPDTEVANAAALVTRQKRHTHFSIDDLTEARVSGGSNRILSRFG